VGLRLADLRAGARGIHPKAVELALIPLKTAWPGAAAP
jgi:hypothetical protein